MKRSGERLQPNSRRASRCPIYLDEPALEEDAIERHKTLFDGAEAFVYSRPIFGTGHPRVLRLRRARAARGVHAPDNDELSACPPPSSGHKSALAGRHLAPSQAAGHPGNGPDTPLLGTFTSPR